LDTTSNDGNEIEKSFIVVSPHPVDQVETTVKTQSKQVMSGDGLSFPGLTDHEQLWQDSNTLQVDTEGPKNFKRSELMVDQESQATDWYDQKLSSESIVITIVGCLEFHVNEVNGEESATDVNTFHHTVV